MPTLHQQIIVNATPKECYRVVADFQNYPSFFPACHSVQIARHEDGFATVTFEMDILMRVKYTIRVIEEPPSNIHWTMENSNVLTLNKGSWEFTAVEEGTMLTYDLEIDFKGRLPDNVDSALTAKVLPESLDLFKKEIERQATK